MTIQEHPIHPVVSVLIPVKNGGKSLPSLLECLQNQSLAAAEILIADSGSSDDSVIIAARYGARVVHIDPLLFDHGGTRTLLAKEARGEILVFFTQDAIPAGDKVLDALVAPFQQDVKVASTFGRQLPYENADYFAASLRRFNYPDRGATFSQTSKEEAGLRSVFTSNSFACYRKSALREIGYFKDNLIFGEDTLAVAQLLQKGYCHVYVAEAAVYHSHNYSLMQEFKRYFDIGVLHERENWFIREYGGAKKRGRAYIGYELRHMVQDHRFALVGMFFLRLLCKAGGYKLGRLHRKLPKSINTLCSMNRPWWGRQE